MKDRQIMGLIATFVAVAEAGSFNRAAERVSRSPSAVTDHINRLEALLEVRLLVRTTRSMRLTDAGEQFLARGRRLLNDTNKLVTDFKDDNIAFTGRLVLAVSPTIAVSLMPKTLTTIADGQPGLMISLMEALRTEMLQLVESGAVAFGIGPYEDVPDALTFRPIFGQEFRLILPEKHPIAARGYARPDDLRDLDMMCPSVGSTARQVLDELTRSAGFKVIPRYETLQYPTLFALVAAGLGATVMPIVDPTLLSASRLVAVPFEDRKLMRTMGVISRRGEVETQTSTLVIKTLLQTVLTNRDRLALTL
mgnify:CR=1 FL=1|tara:strand:- start:873 stop:1796 length:924 start_codon:yes stop_codon:yes gene_type:complete